MKIKFLGIIGVLLILGTLLLPTCASLTVVSAEWDTLKGPDKVRQYYGVNTNDISVYATYKDGSRKEVGLLSTTYDKDKIGVQDIKVHIFNQGTGTFQAEVMELTGIRVDVVPLKKTYNVGEQANLLGIKVMGSWKDMPDAEVSVSQLTVASFNSNSAGTNRLVTVDYKGKTATFPVTVTAPTASAPAPAASSPAPSPQQQTQTSQPSQSTATPPAASQSTPPAQQQPTQQLQRHQLFVGTWKTMEGETLTIKADGSFTSSTIGSGRWSSGLDKYAAGIYIGADDKILYDNVINNKLFASTLDEKAFVEWGSGGKYWRRQ